MHLHQQHQCSYFMDAPWGLPPRFCISSTRRGRMHFRGLGGPTWVWQRCKKSARKNFSAKGSHFCRVPLVSRGNRGRRRRRSKATSFCNKALNVCPSAGRGQKSEDDWKPQHLAEVVRPHNGQMMVAECISDLSTHWEVISETEPIIQTGAK